MNSDRMATSCAQRCKSGRGLGTVIAARKMSNADQERLLMHEDENVSES